MRKSSFCLCALALGMFAVSCSGDDSQEPRYESGAISFNATVPKVPRSEPTTTTSIKDFIVYAFTNQQPYMENVYVTRNGSSWTYSPLVYWPSTPVNFYAYSPKITNAPTATNPQLGSIPGYVNNGSTDLLYAVNIGEMAKATPVNLNFRHAMSRVSVMLSSSNPKIDVRVSYVKLINVYNQGTFIFPQVTTSQEKPDNVGSWSDLMMKNDMLVFMIIGHEHIVKLTSEPVDLTDNTLEVSYFIPQPLTPLDYSGTAYTGSGIEVDCEIFDTATGAKLWPNASTPESQLVAESPTGRLMFPVTTDAVNEWKIGHAYIYNISIDNPDVLKPIMFNVSVDEFKLEQ